MSQDKCPECSAPLQFPEEEEEENKEKNIPREAQENAPKHRGRRKRIVGIAVAAILLILCGAGYYCYRMYRLQQKEQADYERLESVTNPEFYQQFLINYPDSRHYEEIHERMRVLQTEAEEWKQLQQNINRTSVSLFLQKHPNSLRQRACEDMLDSIDWHDALAIGSEEAVADYLAKHPSGLYAGDAAERKNALLLSKVTPEEKAMIRGTLEAFFSKAIAGQDIDAARAAVPDTMQSFCGKQAAVAEDIIEYAQGKMAKDVIGLHYLVGQKLDVHKETLPDGTTGYAVEVSLQETISRSDTNQPSSNLYRVNALLNQEQKIVRMNIAR